MEGFGSLGGKRMRDREVIKKKKATESVKEKKRKEKWGLGEFF